MQRYKQNERLTRPKLWALNGHTHVLVQTRQEWRERQCGGRIETRRFRKLMGIRENYLIADGRK